MVSVYVYVTILQVKIKRRQHLLKKEIEPIFSKDDLKNGPTTEGVFLRLSAPWGWRSRIFEVKESYFGDFGVLATAGEGRHDWVMADEYSLGADEAIQAPTSTVWGLAFSSRGMRVIKALIYTFVLFSTANCPNCGHGKAVFQQLQIRSADEPMSTFYLCLNEKCGHQWRED
ncbi:hypothetical protein C3L33_22347, partial [Rhododendron williamsianum]